MNDDDGQYLLLIFDVKLIYLLKILLIKTIFSMNFYNYEQEQDY